MRKFIFTFVLACSMVGLFAQGEDGRGDAPKASEKSSSGHSWTLDKTHSSFTFTVVHMGIAEVSGTFGEYSATITAASEDFGDASIEFSAVTSSVNTYNEGRNNHLKRADMFDAENHPNITFKSTSVTMVDEGSFKVVGDLTIKGTTKSVSLDMTLNGIADDRRSGGKIAGFTAMTTIKRTDFNVGNMPAMMVGENVKLRISGEFKN